MERTPWHLYSTYSGHTYSPLTSEVTMFNRHTGTGLESAVLAYLPEGFSPIKPFTPRDPQALLVPGERVLVISVWDRDHYLPGAVLLAYVTCLESGEQIHLPITDLIDPATMRRTVDYRQPLPEGRW